VLGIPLYLNASMIVLALLVTVVYGGFVQNSLQVPAPASYVIGFGFVLCLLASVLLHELGHALTARRFGIGVRGITIELLGGYTEMDREAPGPRVDALVALAGPAVSLMLGGLAALAAWALPNDTVTGQIAFQVAASNILVAFFNVLPGLPLDGGRALRALIWALVRDRTRATVVAGWAGRLIAMVTAVAVLALFHFGHLTLFGVVFVLLVVFTLWQGAGQSIRLARMTSRFPLVDLGRLARPVFRVPSGTPLSEAERRGAEEAERLNADGTGRRGAEQDGRPGAEEDWRPGADAGGRQGAGQGGRRRVDDQRPDPALGVEDSSGRLVALVDAGAAARVPAERRPWVPVDTVARDVGRITALKADLTGEQVVRAVQAYPGAQYLVVSGEDVVGVLDVADLAAVLEPRKTVTPAKERS
jgi:Zn-dependent protease